MEMAEQLVFDVEADGFLLTMTKIHCISVKNIETEEVMRYVGSEIPNGLERMKVASVLIGHNICSYDIRAIQKIYPTWTYEGELIDTLLLSCILLPEIGILSLEDWALKLQLPVEKVQNEDWSTYTEHMGIRCDKDVEINEYVYKYLRELEHYKLIPKALKLEQQVALIHSDQTVTGVYFNELKASILVLELDERLKKRREELIRLAPKRVLLFNVPKIRQEEERLKRASVIAEGKAPPGTCKCFVKAGGYTEATESYFGSSVSSVKGPYTKIQIKGLNPDSKDEVKELLLSLGWRPTEWNVRKDEKTKKFRKTSPKLTEDSYESLPEGLGTLVAEYNMMSHRRNWLLNQKDSDKGALGHYSQRNDGRVTPDAFTCGTPTARYRHQGVVCNIPRITRPYGPEIRSLFCVLAGCFQVGVDLSGIEVRCLAHFLLLGNYKKARETADLILSGDFHSVNAKIWKVDRNTAKSILYALGNQRI